MILKLTKVVPRLDIPWVQWIAGLGASLMLFVNALMCGWSSPYLAQLTGPDSPLPLTASEASWVAAYLNVGRILGAPLGAILAHYFGSKKTICAIGFPLAVGWIFVIVADNVIWLYFARIACGFGLGFAFSSFPMYLGEISSPGIRGALVSLAMSGMFTGNLAGNLMGAYLSMAVFAYISLGLTLVFVVLFIWLPESPHFLVERNRIEEARASISTYNPKLDSVAEVESVKNFLAATSSVTFRDRIRELNSPRNRKATWILLALHSFMQFSGLNSLSVYTETILTRARLTIVDPSTMVIIVGAIGVPSGLLPIYTSDKYGRRMSMMLSSAGVAVAMILLGARFAYLENDNDPEKLQWLAVVALIGYQIFLSAGIVPIPNTVLSELFSPSIKSLVACWSSLVIGLYAFVASKSYQPMVDVIGEAYVFWLHAVVMICSVVYSLTSMPETKGKTLQEIQELLGKE